MSLSLTKFQLPELLRNRNVATLSVTWSMMMLAMFTWFPVLPLYLRQMGGDDALIGWCYGALQAGYALPQLLGGILSDRFRKKRLIVLSTVGIAFFYMALFFIKTPVAFIVGLFGVAFLTAFQRPAISVVLAESMPVQQRGMTFGLFELGYTLALTSGPLIGSVLVGKVSVQTLMLATGVVNLAAAALRGWVLYETTSSDTSCQGVDSGGARGISLTLAFYLGAICLIMLIQNLTMQGPFISLHASDTLQLPEAQINMLFAWGGLGAIIAALIAGKLVDRFGGLLTLGASILLHPIAVLVWSSAGGLGGGLAFLIAYMSLEFVMVAYSVLSINLAGNSRRGTIVGLVGSVGGIVAAFAPALGMLVRAAYGSSAPFWLALVLAGAICILLVLIKRTMDKEAYV